MARLLSLALCAGVATAGWLYGANLNAVNGCGDVCNKNGPYVCLGQAKSVKECISACAAAPKCDIMTWSSYTGNCWTRVRARMFWLQCCKDLSPHPDDRNQTDGVWDPTPDDSATAGCENTTVAGCSAPSPWNGTNLSASVGPFTAVTTNPLSPGVASAGLRTRKT